MKQLLLTFQAILISSIIFGQNTNPYKIFGCTTNTNYEIPISNLFRVNNSDSKSNIKALAIDFDKSLAYLLGENDSIIKTLNIDPEEVLIWLSTDPKSDKYPSHSPYNYCANNPVKFIDPNGKDIWIAYQENGKSQKFNYSQNRQGNIPNNPYVQQTVNAMNKASEHPATAAFLDSFTGNTNNAVIRAGNNSQYNNDLFTTNGMNFGTIDFNPTMGITDFSSRKVIPPFVLLIHDLGHLKNNIDNPEEYRERSEPNSNFIWGDNEEEYNIKKYEHPLIDYFNKTGKEEDQLLKRGSYNRKPRAIKTENSTSNQEVK